MVATLQILAVTILSILGALFTASLGWLESGEAFVPRKFAASILRAVIAGFVSALGFSTIQIIGPWEYIVAFLTGAGIDVIGNRASGALKAKT